MTTVRSHGVESNHSKPKKVEDKKDNSQTNKAENPTASKPEHKAPEVKQAGLVDSVDKLDAAIASTPEPKSNKAVASASSNPFGTTAAAASTNGKDKSAAMSTSTNPFGTASTTAMSSSDKDSSSSMAVTIGSDGSTNVAMSTSNKDSSSSMGVSTNANGTSVAMAASDKDSSSSMAVSTGSNGTAAAMSSTYNDTSSSAAVATSGSNPFCPPTPETTSVATAASSSCETTTSVAAAASSSCETTTAVAAAASSSCNTSSSVAVAAASSSCNTSSSVAVAAASSGSSSGGSVSVLDEGKGAWGDPHFEIAVDKNKNGKLDSGEKTSFDHKGVSGNTYQIFKADGMDIKAKYEDTNNPDAPQVMGEVSINDKFKITKDGKLMSMDGKPMTLEQARQLGLDIQKTANGYMIKGANGSGDIEIKCNGTYIDIDPKGDFNNATGILGEAMSMFADGKDPASKGNDYWNKYDMGKML